MPTTEGAPAHGQPSHLLPMTYKRMVSAWLEEDTPSFDYGGFVVGEDPAEAHLLAKSPGILAGLPFITEVFTQLSCKITWHVPEGTLLTPTPTTPRIHIATVHGPVRHILLGERVALNALARCSGIAAQTQRTLALLRKAGYKNTLAGTRKTTPGFRLVEKYGMLVGGADAHRFDLSAMVMLKDNHIWACSGRARRRGAGDGVGAAIAASPSSSAAAGGGTQRQSTSHASTNGEAGEHLRHGKAANTSAIHAAIAAARSTAGFALKIEVECQSYDEAVAAITGGADIVMLDNFTPEDLQNDAMLLKKRYHISHADESVVDRQGEGSEDGRRREFLIEVSGGLTEENVADYVCPAVDVISTSSIHQGVRHVDFSLKVVQDPEDHKSKHGGGSSEAAS